MSRVRDDQHVEFLARFYERVHDAQGLCGRIIAVHVARREQQLALEIRGAFVVRLLLLPNDQLPDRGDLVRKPVVANSAIEKSPKALDR